MKYDVLGCIEAPTLEVNSSPCWCQKEPSFIVSPPQWEIWSKCNLGNFDVHKNKIIPNHIRHNPILFKFMHVDTNHNSLCVFF